MKKSLQLLMMALGAAAAQELEASLSLADSTGADHLNVLFELNNPSQETLSINRYFTPLSGVRRPVFTLTQGGDVVSYTGIIALHLESPDLYVNLAPGETMNVTVDIADYYDIRSTGEYSLSWKHGSGNDLVLDVTHAMKRAPKILQHYVCSDEQKAQLRVADGEALMQASSAIRCLDRGEACRERAKNWFGEPSNDFSDVRAKYVAIKTTIENGYRVDCAMSDCNPNTYAYVYPSDRTLTSYLCPVFWQIPDERGETILHEVSHFNLVARTDDHAYGRYDCKQLAKNSPAKARENADNLGYFGKGASVDMDECELGANPCQNGGRCVDTKTALCECVNGFSGDLCQTCTRAGGCGTSTCTDGKKNGDETDVDCGGSSCRGCYNGRTCRADGDCVSGSCRGGKCMSACSDGVKNFDETDVDCGGAVCSKCPVNKACRANGDCRSGLSCRNGRCLAADTCSDGVKNSDETDVDCGGSKCDSCLIGEKCLANSDCASNSCKNGVCVGPNTCYDKVKNGDETDMDCGGSCWPCRIKKRCSINWDCRSKNCKNGKCYKRRQRCKNKKQNPAWGESDVDCGGPLCPRCGEKKKCLMDTDCVFNMECSADGNTCQKMFGALVTGTGYEDSEDGDETSGFIDSKVGPLPMLGVFGAGAGVVLVGAAVALYVVRARRNKAAAETLDNVGKENTYGNNAMMHCESGNGNDYSGHGETMTVNPAAEGTPADSIVTRAVPHPWQWVEGDGTEHSHGYYWNSETNETRWQFP